MKLFSMLFDKNSNIWEILDTQMKMEITCDNFVYVLIISHIGVIAQCSIESDRSSCNTINTNSHFGRYNSYGLIYNDKRK